MPMFNKNYDFDKDALLHKLQSEVDSMTTGLTDKQKELFQEDKYVLVDTIVILESKLKKLVGDLQFTENEMFLTIEALKSELETERQARVTAEGACIASQQEIDGTLKAVELSPKQKEDMMTNIEESKDDYNEKVLRAIGKYEKKVVEEGENGSL